MENEEIKGAQFVQEGVENTLELSNGCRKFMVKTVIYYYKCYRDVTRNFPLQGQSGREMMRVGGQWYTRNVDYA